jgi:hypothetical protein
MINDLKELGDNIESSEISTLFSIKLYCPIIYSGVFGFVCVEMSSSSQFSRTVVYVRSSNIVLDLGR